MKNNYGKMGYGALRAILQRQQPIMEKLYETYGSADPEELMKLVFENSANSGADSIMPGDEAECEICREYSDMLLQALMLKGMLPCFDLDTELADPRFSHLVLQPPHGAGLSLEDAYHAMHRREAEEALHRQQLQLAGYAARNTARKLASAIMTGGMRPTENGMNASAAAFGSIDPRKLTREERAEIRKRVNSGEKIHW